MMNECGADCLSVDQKNDITQSRREVGSEAVIFGNFDPYRTLVAMDRGEVAAVIRKCIADGVDAVWPGCDLWPAAKGTTFANMCERSAITAPSVPAGGVIKEEIFQYAEQRRVVKSDGGRCHKV